MPSTPPGGVAPADIAAASGGHAVHQICVKEREIDAPGDRVVTQPAEKEPTTAELLARIDDLQAQLATLPMIERAKGALMAVYGLTADAAFALLRWHSQQTNVKLRSIAAELATRPLAGLMSPTAAARLDGLIGEITDDLRSAGASRSAARSEKAQLPGVRQYVPTQPRPATDRAGERTAVPGGELPKVLLRAVDNAPYGVTIAINLGDRPLVYANDAFLRLTGYSSDQVLGRNCRFLQGTHTGSADTAAIVDALNTGTDISRVIRNYRQDGTAFYNEVTISAVRHPATAEISHFLGTQMQMSERAAQSRDRHFSNQ